jgi:hypothetical protein
MSGFKITTVDELIEELSKYRGMVVAVDCAGEVIYDFEIAKHPTAVPETVCIEVPLIN